MALAAIKEIALPERIRESKLPIKDWLDHVNDHPYSISEE